MGRKKQTKEQEKKKLEASAAISMSMEIVSMASQFSKDADTPALAAPKDTQIEQEKEDINVVKSPTKRWLPITETKCPLTNRPAQTQIEQEKEDINVVKSPTKRCLPITETKSPLTNRPAQTQIEQEKEDILNIVKSPTKRCLPITETKSPLTNRPAQTQIEQEKEDINIVKSPTKRCLPITETKSPLTNRPTPVNDFSDSAVNHSYIDMHLSRHHSTPLTETWGLCQRSMQFPISNNNCQSQAATNSNIPVPSPQVLETLRGILLPDFQTYAREFLDHFGHAQYHQNYSFQQSICNQTNYQGQGYNSFTESVMEYGNLSSEYYNLSPRRSPRLMKSSTPRLSQSPNGIVKSTAPRRSLLPTLSEDDGGSATVTSIPASTVTPQISVPHSNQREGNGSTTESGSYTPDCESSKQVKIKLLENCLFEVEKLALKKITAMARKNINPGYTLCLKMLPLLFTEEEMARSRGQGLIKPKPGDLRPSLDKNKILAVKDYVKSWCRKNNFSTPSEARLNDAITEKIAYCRKLMKKHQK
ncbi:uncharacterized protein LOC125668246 [Ostrea edulis]|uniref:uncharacterized protein LOC125668246 n=1 Tax=Ostrea edulis TaxID=37623 RepID=UPI0024AF487D|nr:uncharacterized protein LOC125668246 [Ostrea edulis]XP_048758061.2 uncharacterized protein LOC125668246 [Ostrea edulis]XP_048758062.2 uncharacterized protein LOC125668246 [Ostrea edulis]